MACLALAFDGLDAEFALTGAWHDNEASLGVTRSLGYVEEGRRRELRRGVPMTRSSGSAWPGRTGTRSGATTSSWPGCLACRSFLGL